MRAPWILLLLAAAPLTACEGDGNVGNTNGAGGFNPSTLEFGARRVGAIHEMTTTLTMAEALTVTEVRFEPAGTVYAARVAGGSTLRGTVLRPNTTINVVLQFRPTIEGDYDGKMIVVFNDQTQVELVLTARGRVGGDGDLTVTPSEISIMETEVGADVTQPLALENQTDEALTVSSVQGMTGPLMATGPYTITRPGGLPFSRVEVAAHGQVPLELHFHPMAVGTFLDTIVFSVDGSAVRAQLRAQGTGVPAGDISCTPNTIDFGPIVRGATSDQSATCRVTGGTYTLRSTELEGVPTTPFRLMAAPANNTALHDGDSFELRAQFRAAGAAVSHSGSVRLESGRGQVRIVGLRAQVAAPATGDIQLALGLSWTPAAHDLDLHLVRQGGVPFSPLDDCFFQRKVQEWGQSENGADDPVLDRDSAAGGPEIINLQRPAEPSYEVYVHYYSASDVQVTANVDLTFRGTPGPMASHVFTACGQLWHVGTIYSNGGGFSFTPDSSVTDARTRARCN